MSPEAAARTAPAADSAAAIDRAIDAARGALAAAQAPDGHWLFELEADATIPAEYVLMRHYRGEPIDTALEGKIGVYLRRIQGAHGGWPLYHGGAFDVSASVKAYFALKMIGDDIETPHMRCAREAILAHGGGSTSNVFTRFLLALYGILSWHSVPLMPVEIVLLPPWFPFHLSKVSYWARTVLVPLLVLQALQPRAKNPRGVRIDELFVEDPASVKLAPKAPHQKWRWFLFFRAVDIVLRGLMKVLPGSLRRRAIDQAVAFVSERLNGQDGLGAIFPAMVNSVMMFDLLGMPEKAAIARDSVERLLVIKTDEAYCQPCLSPIWDSALASQALLEIGDRDALTQAKKSMQWLVPLQVLDIPGDWIARRPGLRPGGWAFQYANPHYPDLDDTAVIIMAMDRLRRVEGTRDFDAAIGRAVEWVRGMQSGNGGWAAFDVDNIYDYLNNIPFADHGALIDPPTEDVGARCVSALAQIGARPDDPAIRRGVRFLLERQLPEGSWYGRWGVNYIYGTWSVLCALRAAGVPRETSAIRKAADWLIAIQNPDGGWGESGFSYRLDYHGYEAAPSTASQTAWALLALMAAGEVEHPALARGIAFLTASQDADGFWSEEFYTGTGFPRVFYLRYHGYRKYFPLWALARYRNLTRGNGLAQPFGM
ncbi:MAG TPA: squalene--hopene cyclase [Pseudolabrys sp.]|nr:squalene--hopene cyclase [Pseudolabrys sp.]